MSSLFRRLFESRRPAGGIEPRGGQQPVQNAKPPKSQPHPPLPPPSRRGLFLPDLLAATSQRRMQLTEEECLARGGHCWEYDNMVYASNPPQYSQHCKHCSATRAGSPREAMEWRET